MEVSGQIHAPAAILQEKESSVPIGQKAGWDSGMDAVAKRRILCPFRESNPGRPVQSLVTILTELSRLLFIDADPEVELATVKS
jgi:hypothetical protein